MDTLVVGPPVTGPLTADPHDGAGGGIDVSNIGFGAHTTRGYSANSDNGGGTLTVSGGPHAAKSRPAGPVHVSPIRRRTSSSC